MGLGNAIPIRYHGEVLAVVDPAEIHSVEPYSYTRTMPTLLHRRVWEWMQKVWLGRSTGEVKREQWTKIAFKDGTWVKVRMPFIEFVSAYC